MTLVSELSWVKKATYGSLAVQLFSVSYLSLSFASKKSTALFGDASLQEKVFPFGRMPLIPWFL